MQIVTDKCRLRQTNAGTNVGTDKCGVRQMRGWDKCGMGEKFYRLVVLAPSMQVEVQLRLVTTGFGRFI